MTTEISVTHRQSWQSWPAWYVLWAPPPDPWRIVQFSDADFDCPIVMGCSKSKDTAEFILYRLWRRLLSRCSDAGNYVGIAPWHERIAINPPVQSLLLGIKRPYAGSYVPCINQIRRV